MMHGSAAPWAAVIFAAAAVQSLVAVSKPGAAHARAFLVTREADATHLVMNGVMAVMATPLYTPKLQAPACLLLGATGLVLLAQLGVHGRGHAPTDGLSLAAKRFGTGYHVVMLAAMIYATIAMAPMTAMGGMVMAAPRGLTLPDTIAAAFLLDAVTGAAAVALFPAALIGGELSRDLAGPQRRFGRAPISSKEVRTLRLGLLPHLVMDFGMAWMLLSL